MSEYVVKYRGDGSDNEIVSKDLAGLPILSVSTDDDVTVFVPCVLVKRV
jgi:hypothetical protein